MPTVHTSMAVLKVTLGVIGAYESAFGMLLGVQVAVQGKGWMVLAIDNYDRLWHILNVRVAYSETSI